MPALSLVGPSSQQPSRVHGVGRAVNLVPCPIEADDRLRAVYRDFPGLTQMVDLGGAIRGAIKTNGRSFVVAGTSILELHSDYTTTNRGSLPGTGWCEFAAIQNFVVVTNTSGMYAMDRISGTTFNVVASYPGGPRIDSLNEYILFIHADSGRFGWCNVGDATTIDALSFATAESSPDDLIALIVSNEEVLLIGRDGTEAWANVGGDEVFARRTAAIEAGTESPYSARALDNSVFWVGSSEKFGQGAVYRLNGYTPARISTRFIEQQLSGIDLSDAYAFTLQDEGNALYVLQVPGLTTTLVYDVLTGLWFEAAELVDGDYERWRGDVHLFAHNIHLIGDADGKLYKLDKDAHTNAGDALCRSRVLPVISSKSRNRIRLAGFSVLCDVGYGGEMMVRISGDNGAAWGSWRTASLGEIGEYSKRVKMHRCGSGLDIVIELRVTSNVPWNPADVDVSVA